MLLMEVLTCFLTFCLQERNIRFAPLPTEDDEANDDEEPITEDKLQEARIMAALGTAHVSGATVELDEEGALSWPVRFLYPDYSQSDLFEAFHEDSR